MKSRTCCAITLFLCHFIWICVSKETTQKAEKRFDVRGKEWVAAQKIINKLVDESIASRVTEAEHDVEHLLESNIADHIKKTGKTILRKIPKECSDKIEHCMALAKSGVCKTSPKAMRQHCAKTCNLCEDNFIDVTPHVTVSLQQEPPKKLVNKLPVAPVQTTHYHKTVKIKAVPQKPKAEHSSRKNDLARFGEGFIPADTLQILHSIEPLLSQQTKGVMKFHENDLSPENEKIRDAQKLLEYVKVLNPPKKMSILDGNISFGKGKKKSTTSKKPKKANKHEDEEDEKEENGKQKDKVKEDDKPKPKPKPKHSNKAAKSSVAKKKKPKVKGTPLTSLTKTVTFKDHKYKITPVVDWERISKMLESLGYKAVHIVGVKEKSIHKDLTEHLKKHGVDKILTHKGKEKAAAETFVSAVHREKSWHNDEYFKKNCHPMCLKTCIGSCRPGCCREHDQVSVVTGLPKHCHEDCLTKCVPSCGSGCCSAEEERKRGHHFLHYQRIKDYHKAKEEAKNKKKSPLAEQHDEPKKKYNKKQQDKLNIKCHPQCKETCITSCGEGCCTEEAEKLRDENEKKLKDERERKRKEKAKALLEMYKPQARLCPAPCPKVCAPACADDCCSFGKYAAPPAPGMSAVEQPHPGFVPNVPYPHSKLIPMEAFACTESCKFKCTVDCPRDCCQPEEVALEQAHEAAALASPTTVGAPQTMAYEGFAPVFPTCPSPCPGGCYPSCTVACCTSALGLPQENDAESSPETLSSTKRVLHVTHLVRPITGFNGCALSCASLCTPACARSGCCDSSKRRKRSSS